MLTFLNSYLLPALSLAALPILIHLLTRHKIREQEFSDIRFLAEIHKKRMRRMKLRQWLLLILRTLALFFVISAFTRPAIRGVQFGGVGGHEQTAVAILLDNSFSTGAIKGNTNIFTYEKAIANKILALLEEGDVASVGIFNEDTRWLTPKPSRFFANLSAILDTISLSDKGTNISQAVESAIKNLENFPSLYKEIYILTDNTAIGWRKSKFETPDNTTIYALTFSPDKISNRTITEITFPPQLLEAKKLFELSIGVKNNVGKSVQGVLVSLIVDGKKTSQSVLELPAGAQITTELSGQVSSGGFHWGYAECSEDNLPPDNRRYFTFRIPEKVEILLVGKSDMRRFVKLALAPEGKSKFFELKELTMTQLGQEYFENFDVVVLLDPYNLTESSLQRLRTFVSKGGGLFVFPGNYSAQNPGKYQNILREFGNITVNGAIGDTSGISQLLWGQKDFNHPVLSVFDETGLPEAKFHKIIDFDIHDGRIFLWFENDMPALTELARGDGRIVIAGFSTDLHWGNLAISGFFVPMVQRVCQYLASDVAYFDEGVIVGRKIARTIQDYSGAGKLRIIYPGGGGTYTIPRFVGGKAMFFMDNIHKAGIYTVVSGNDTLDMFCANINPAEGDLTPLEKDEREKFDIYWLEPDKDISEQILSVHYGIELWRTLLLLALVFLAAEMIVEKNWKNSS